MSDDQIDSEVLKQRWEAAKEEERAIYEAAAASIDSSPEARPAPPDPPSFIPAAHRASSNKVSGFRVITGILIVTAIVFAIKGWYTLYDNSYDARIVGGDAYNFIIYASRGTAYICLGIVCSVLSATFALLDLKIKKE